MAIIYSYPTKITPVGADMVLITDSESTDPANQTKQVSISSIQGLTAGVSSINGLAGIVTLSAGSNIAFTTVGNDISIASTGGGSGTVTGTGTRSQLPMWDAAGTGITDSVIYQNAGGTTVSIPVNTIQINESINHFGDSDTFIGFPTDDEFSVTAGSNKNLQVNSSNVTLYREGNAKAETGDGGFTLLGGGGSASNLRFNCSNNNHWVDINGPDHTGAVSYALTLPNTLPSVANQILESNASGTLSWIATPSGSGGVSSFTNANGTFISAATVNTSATGAVTTGAIDLSATGTPTSENFLRGDNTWAIPSSVTYSAGTGLGLLGTTFFLATGAALSNLGGGSGGEYLRKDGSWATPTDTNTNIANAELTLNANRILALSSYSLKFTGTNIVQFSNQGSARNLSVLVDHNLEVDGQAWVNSYAAGESTGTVNIDWNESNVQEFTLSGNVAWTCTNQKAGGTYIMIVNQPAGQSYTQTFSQDFDWADNNTAPATTTAARADVYSFVCRTSSGSMLGTFSQNFI